MVVNEKEKMAADGALHSLLLTWQRQEGEGADGEGSREELISLLHLAASSWCHQLRLHSSQRALAACTLLLLAEKFRRFSRLDLNIPKIMRCLGFFNEVDLILFERMTP